MWTLKNWNSLKRRCLEALLVSLWLLFSGSSCTSASAGEEGMYTITEEELTQLELNLDELSSVNIGQREKLASLQERLKTSETRLAESEKNSKMLSVKLDWLSKELDMQSVSLENANKLLQEYEDEERRTKSRLKRQRNIGYVLAVIAIGFCIAK